MSEADNSQEKLRIYNNVGFIIIYIYKEIPFVWNI